ncbi:MAG: aquaporin [Thermoplasmata archaeon]|nr:aquaporin [Thermoplasmata archaeon]
MNRPLRTRLIAEICGTGLLVGMGTGSIVAAARWGVDSIGVIAVAWFLAVTIPVLWFARISGAHINPVVTMALTAGRRFPLAELPMYVGAQLIGAFTASAGVWLLLGDGARLGATQFREGGVVVGAIGEFVFTFILILLVFFLVDFGPGLPRWGLTGPGIVVGISTYLIGPWSGSSLNPARTLAPAVLSWTFSGLWVYLIVVPLAGLAAVPAADYLRSRMREPR